MAKKGLHEWSIRSNWGPRKDQRPFRSNLNEIGHVKAAVGWCGYAYLAVTDGKYAGDVGRAVS